MNAPALNAIQQHTLDDMTSRMEGIREGFSAIDDMNTPTIPEIIFVRDFLPLFSGEDDHDKDRLLTTWYVIAGSPYSPVNVIDALGNKVIQVPAILDRNSLTPSISGTNLGAIFEEAKQRSYMSPALGERIINDELTGRFLSGPKGKINSAMASQWDALFAHYKKTGAVKTQTTQAEESDFDME